MFVKKFKETKCDPRPSSICHFVLPPGKIGRLAAGVVEVAPGGCNISCPHTAWRQVFFILEGKGELVLDAKKHIPIEANMTVEIPYDTEHKIVASKSGPLRYLYVNDYSQPVAKNVKESAAAYKLVKAAAHADLKRGMEKMIEKPEPPASPRKRARSRRQG